MLSKYQRMSSLVISALVLAVIALGGSFVNPKVASANGSCKNLQRGQNNPGFTSTTISYTVFGDIQYVGNQAVTLDLEGAASCDGPGSRYVRAKATLRDGSGEVQAFVDQLQSDGTSAFIAGTPVTKTQSNVFHPVYSKIWNAAGLVVRACGNFQTGGLVGLRCGDWVSVVAVDYGPCTNIQPGENNVGFNNTSVSYTTNNGAQYLGNQRFELDLEGAGNCDGPGSRYVRAKVWLWDGSAAVTAFVDQLQSDGTTAPIVGTPVTKNPGDFGHPVYSNIWNAAGLTVRACGHFQTEGMDELRCTNWVTVPA